MSYTPQGNKGKELSVSVNGNNSNAVEGDPDKPWLDPWNASNTLMFLLDNYTILVNPGTYNWTSAISADTNIARSLIKNEKTTIVIPGKTIISTDQNAAVLQFLANTDDFVVYTLPSLEWSIDAPNTTIIGDSTASAGVLFGVYGGNRFSLNVDRLEGLGSTSWIGQSSCEYNLININDIYHEGKQVAISLVSDAGPDKVRYFKCDIGKYVCSNTVTSTGGLFRCQPKESTGFYYEQNINNAEISGTSGRLLQIGNVEDTKEWVDSTVIFNCKSLVNTQSTVPSLVPTYTQAAIGSTELQMWYGTYRDCYIEINIDYLKTNQIIFANPNTPGTADTRLDGSTLIIKGKTWISTGNKALDIRNVTLTNGARIIIDIENCISEAAEAIVFNDNVDIDATSGIEIRGRYETTDAGSSVIEMSTTIVNPGRIMLKEAVLINDGVADCINTNGTSEITVTSAYSNGGAVDASVTQNVGTVVVNSDIT